MSESELNYLLTLDLSADEICCAIDGLGPWAMMLEGGE